MGTITAQEFAIRQPYYPAHPEHEAYYLKIANGIYEVIAKDDLGSGMSQGMRKHLAMSLAGYFQDIVADAGLWSSFITANKELYGWLVPFHDISADYVEFELNREDIEFLVWYDCAMLDSNQRLVSPLDSGIVGLAEKIFEYLEVRYDEAPVNEECNIARGLSYTDPEDQEDIMHLARWLFMQSWLLAPAFAATLQQIALEPEVRDDREGIVLQSRFDEAVTEYPTGPLALYSPEWVYLLLTGKLPDTARDKQPSDAPVHPYYQKFIAATDGRKIAYFSDYDELNRFFIHSMGWEKGERHLDQFAGDHDFVLMVDEHKGMLLAKNIAKCIADPENPLYDWNYASGHAIELLTQRGLCPADLLKFIFANGWLPDAHFLDSDNHQSVGKYHDFIARCYLQEYFRGD